MPGNNDALRPSGRKLWTMAKLWMALRDFPEVGALVFLIGGAYVCAGYTARRIYFAPAGGSYLHAEVRADWEKQANAYGPEVQRPSMWYKIAQWKLDDKGYNTGIFDNRARPFEYNLNTKTLGHSAPQYETSVGTRVALPE